MLVYRRHIGIPKGLNFSAKLQKENNPDAKQWEGWHSCFRNEWEAIVLVQKPLDTNYETNVHKYGVGIFNTKHKDGSFASNIIEGISNRKDYSLTTNHVNGKPRALIERLIQMLVPPKREHVVLDPFCGNGTTLLAARNIGVSYIGIDIDPNCIEAAAERLRQKSDLLSLDGEFSVQRAQRAV
jgi:site-specific DNA-methyltransferase (adenine-specific)